jgi:hypothetical protein
MKFTLFLLIVLLASCHIVDRTVPFRAQELFISSIDYKITTVYPVEIVYADSAYRAGDTAIIDNKTMHIIERVR